MWDYREESQVYHRGRCNHCGALTPEFPTPDRVRLWMDLNEWEQVSPVAHYCPCCGKKKGGEEMISRDYVKRHGYGKLTPVKGEPVTDIMYFENGGQFQ